MKAQGGYPANRRRAGAANNFTPALNNITGPSKPFSLPKKKAPGNNYKVPKTPKVSGLGWGG
jgi:hypothetical protein